MNSTRQHFLSRNCYKILYTSRPGAKSLKIFDLFRHKTIWLNGPEKNGVRGIA